MKEIILFVVIGLQFVLIIMYYALTSKLKKTIMYLEEELIITEKELLAKDTYETLEDVRASWIP